MPPTDPRFPRTPIFQGIAPARKVGGARSKSIASLRAPPAQKARAARLAPVALNGSPEDRTIGGSIGARGKFPLKSVALGAVGAVAAFAVQPMHLITLAFGGGGGVPGDGSGGGGGGGGGGPASPRARRRGRRRGRRR